MDLLREAGLIRRGPRGYSLKGAAAPSHESLEQLLQTYVERARRDKDRLAEMMHYAETPNCRTQVIRAYFGEPEGEPCIRFDNCALKYPGQASPEAMSLARQPGRDAGPNAVEGRAVESPETSEHHEPVHTIQTKYGEIHTTAPETVPQPETQSPFQPGDKVRHKRFGSGSVLDIHDDMILVDFLKGGSKRLRADFLEAAWRVSAVGECPDLPIPFRPAGDQLPGRAALIIGIFESRRDSASE